MGLGKGLGKGPILSIGLGKGRVREQQRPEIPCFGCAVDVVQIRVLLKTVCAGSVI
jgi:hypothetical protein